nr:polysaccharide deacetylase [Lysinibacter cavernae]
MTLPEGKTFGLAITVDMDGHAVWLAKGKDDPSYLARGEYGPEVGVPRLLDLFDRYNLRTSWGIPGHTLLTWPERSREVADRGHEIFAHGVYHENLLDMPRGREDELLARQIEQHLEVIGTRPRGYRVPSGPLTEHTYELLEAHGFEWSSSTSGRDFEPYYPRAIVSIDREDRTVFGREYNLLEFSVSWYLEDWMAFEFVAGSLQGLSSTQVVFDRWKDSLDWGMKHCPGGVMVLVLHPQCIGRPHHMLMLERFIDYCAGLDSLWITGLNDAYDAWSGKPAVFSPNPQ